MGKVREKDEEVGFGDFCNVREDSSFTAVALRNFVVSCELCRVGDTVQIVVNQF